MKIEYDDIYKKWIVWEVSGSLLIEKYKSKLERDCQVFIKRHKKTVT